MAISSGPLKSDIEAVFNRLRSLATNKVIEINWYIDKSENVLLANNTNSLFFP